MSRPKRLMVVREVRDIPSVVGRTEGNVLFAGVASLRSWIRPTLTQQGETSMKNTTSWPPSSRDFEVYRRLHVDGGSTRDVAHETNLSQTRVCQIAEKVANYLLSVVPAKENRQREQQLVVGEQVASMRVDFLYGAAMQGWRDSQGTQTTTRQLQTPSQPTRTVITTKNSPGDCRYLLVAARLSLISSRLPISCLEFHAADEDESDEADGGSEAAASPPVRACSPIDAEPASEAVSATNKSLVSRLADKGYAQLTNPPTNDRREIFAPVQQPQPREYQNVLSLAPPATSPPLSRQQRRARQRLLERKLGGG